MFRQVLRAVATQRLQKKFQIERFFEDCRRAVLHATLVRFAVCRGTDDEDFGGGKLLSKVTENVKTDLGRMNDGW